MMTQLDSTDDAQRVARARGGDRKAFDQLALGSLRPLRAVIRRMVGHPDVTDELTQLALLKAYQGLPGFRGESSFTTWACSIAVRLCVDHLRAQKRWRLEAQEIYARRAATNEDISAEVGAVLMDPEFTFDARNHVAYCFTCVGRSLPPEQQAALVLKDVLDYTNREAADALGLSHSAFRHKLSAARSKMDESYRGLCAIISKQGMCYQCEGLRKNTPPERQGPPVHFTATGDEPKQRLQHRLRIVSEAQVDGGPDQALRDVFFRQTAAQEHVSEGSLDDGPSCSDDLKR